MVALLEVAKITLNLQEINIRYVGIDVPFHALILDHHSDFTILPQLIHHILNDFYAQNLPHRVLKAKIMTHFLDLIELVDIVLAPVKLIVVIIVPFVQFQIVFKFYWLFGFE